MIKQSDSPASFLRDIGFLGGYVALCLLMMAVLRALLFYRNIELSEAIPSADIINAFLVGILFDLIIASVIGAPLVFALLLPNGLGERKWAIIWLVLVGAMTTFVGIVDLDFYHEFHVRLNSLAFQYLKEDPATVSSMIWNGFPVVRYLLLWSLILAIYIAGLRWINRLTAVGERAALPFAFRLVGFLLVFFLFAWGGRGTLRSGPPLRWGDAFQSQHLFANHLGLNSSYTFIKAILAASKENPGKKWLKVLPDQDAVEVTREMLITKQDRPLNQHYFPVLREHTPVQKLEKRPENVVFIIMESFSAEFVGVLGHHYRITPEFDKLAKEGLLFDHFFSNGTHTHQGMFATVACFSNLPGHEYLMQQAVGQHAFSGLPAVLQSREFSDVYVYNGDFSWDNQSGFFTNQGMTRFVGKNSYKNPKFSDPTWGVSDEDMFDKAIEEIDGLPTDRPFYAVLQSLSNHTPYALPENLPVEAVTGFGDLDQHLTAQRYSDWALGQFFKQAKKSKWYKETVFVIVGDHGFGVRRQLSEIDLLRFHVPMLIIAPGIQASYGARNHIAGSQVDIVPTLVSLLGEPFSHQCWGRDLLALPANDLGFAVIKPSGSDQTVAFIEGDKILIKRPHEKPILGQYSFYPEEKYQHLEDDKRTYAMELRLKGFVQTAMKALYENRAGRVAVK
jgi:phosphoglycerol transferase MdoB-like AlkP superfamily enzyme